MTVAGPDFIALQVRDLRAATTSRETRLGLRRLPGGPPGAVVVDTAPVPVAVRTPLPGVDLDAASPRPGIGVALWLRADDSQVLPDALVSTGVPVPAPPVDGPFGRTFTSTDPDGDAVTVHDRG
jgi:hypothetical protein